ncbi:MAG: hypothetical protein U5K54_16780 [Cytophagales bacterium]|nr:hypothetical protein [Cytophagales bacterium]
MWQYYSGTKHRPLSAGEIWSFFEQELQYPITQIGTEYFKSVDLSKYDVLIVPEGRYRMFDEGTLTDISTWVSSGGRLIVIANALGSFADKKGFALKTYASDEEKERCGERKIKELKRKMP